MPSVTIMAWNIENFGTSKYNAMAGGPELLDLITRVILHTHAEIIGLSEMRSNLGANIGTDIVNRLNALSFHTWQSQPSIQFVNHRQEQYVFIWDTGVVQPYNAPNSFQYQFQNQSPPPAFLGFPQQVANDRPPYLGYFQTLATPQKRLLIANFHAPAPNPYKHCRNGIRKLAQVTEFPGGDTCVIMGDFNIKKSNDATDPNCNGGASFGNLVTLGFSQRFVNVESSLIKKFNAFTGMLVGDCYNEPYDNIFFRNNANGVTIGNEGMEELIQECMTGYLTNYLAAVNGVNTGMTPAGYATVEAAFLDYRIFVSDHMPVVADISF